MKLGDKVKANQCPKFGTNPKKGVIVQIGFKNGINNADGIFYTVRGEVGSHNYMGDVVTLIKTQTLRAYKDETDEIHWSTRKYSTSELKDFGFVEANEFNKTIDLE